jgi:hypothetical protein
VPQPPEEQLAATADLSDLDALDVTDREHWEEGPPQEIFRELRGRCPVHW